MVPQRILVIDDEVNLADLIRDILEGDDYEVYAAHNGTKGLEMVEALKPDLLILDVELPDINGYDICRKLRENVQTCHLPIVMLTVKGSVVDEMTGLSIGADDYITKPFKPALLKARIDMAIARNIRELDANPLTRLPGNVTIMKELEKRLRQSDPFAVLYLDLNHFKSFNDYYGFVRGDEVIKITAQLILQTLNETKSLKDFFLGHIGGDDFVAIVSQEHLETLCETIITRFDALAPKFYNAEDRQRGHIVVRDRRGKQTIYKFIAIAIGVVTNHDHHFAHPGQISAVASDLKQLAKAKSRSSYIIDRRRGTKVTRKEKAR